MCVCVCVCVWGGGGGGGGQNPHLYANKIKTMCSVGNTSSTTKHRIDADQVYCICKFMFKLTMQVNTPQSSVLFCFGISYSNAIQVCVHIANYSDTFEYY